MFFHPSCQFILLVAAAAATTTATIAASLFFYKKYTQAKNNKKKREQEKEEEQKRNPIFQSREYIKKRNAEFLKNINNDTTTNTTTNTKDDSPNYTKLQRKNQNPNQNQNIDPVVYSIARLRKALEDSSYEDEEKRWRSRVLVEYTPMGNIIMNYDFYRFGFSYYSDNNSLNYELLNAVAMKYVKTFRCLDFFMDENYYKLSPLYDVFYIEDKKTPASPASEETSIDKKNTIDSNDDVFLKKTIKNNSAAQQNQPPQKQHRKTEHKKRVNKFIKCGKIDNFSFLSKPPKRGVFSIHKDENDVFMQNLISYADYKNKKTAFHHPTEPLPQIDDGDYVLEEPIFEEDSVESQRT